MPADESNHLSRRLLAHMPMATALLTPELRVRAWDLSGVDLCDADGDFADMYIVDLPWWRDDEEVRWFLDGAARRALAGETVQFEGPYTRGSGSDGTMWFRLAPYREEDDAAVSGVVILAQDMTDWAADRNTGRALMNELNHRVKNMLALVSSIVNLNLRKSRDIKDAQERIGQRLAAYARAQELVFQEGLEDVTLANVVDQALVPFPRSRTDLDMADGKVSARTAMVLGLALHELGMNAVKYGAWSNGTGRVRLSAASSNDGLRLRWAESGGPKVVPPNHEGFGTTLTTRVLKTQTRGTVTCDYPESGMIWTLVTESAV